MLGELHHATTLDSIDMVACPECGSPADIAWRATHGGSSGGVDMAKVHCSARHWFLMPADQLQSI